VRRVLLAACVLAALVGIVVGFFWMRRGESPPQLGRELISPIVELGLSLQAPEGPADPGSPIYLSLGLASPRVINLLAHDGREALDDLPDLTIGTGESPWWSEIRLVARAGEDEQELPWTPLPRAAEPVADLSDGLGRSIRAIVKPGEMRLRGPLRLQATMTWKGEILGSNELDLDVRPESLDDTTKATLFTEYHLEMGDLEEARRSVEELVRLQPREPNTHALRARVLEETGDLEGAQRSWVRAIELLPEDLEEAPTIYFENLRAVEDRLAGTAAPDRAR
jgi:hypothetical protein